MLEKFFVVSDVRHRLYLTAKPSHVGVDREGRVYPPPPRTILQHVAIRRGDIASYQALSCLVAIVGSGAFPGDVKPSGLDIGGELTMWIPALPNLTWGKSFLLGDAYLMVEPSWCLGVYPWSSCYCRQ
jgi:hypothetical protein